MASASADDHRDLLHLESVPLIDLRYLSQSELYSLSLCSPSSLSSHRRLDDDLLIPKIDRSVFNESAGSRKQTYSRLRLAPRKPHSLSPAAPTPAPSTNPAYLDTENAQIVALLKKLFGAETPATDPDPIPLPVELGDPAPQPSDAVLDSVPVAVVETPAAVFETPQVGIVGDPVKEVLEFSNSGSELVPISGGGSELAPISGGGGTELAPISGGGSELVPVSGGGDSDRKRKRGRPRKNEIRVVNSARKSRKVVGFRAEVVGSKNGVEAKEMSIVNRNGVAVDVTALGNLADPFGEELRKRTQGFQTKQQFLEYLDGVKGEWCSMRKKRKVVDASDFGDALPMGWKLVLCMKKQAGRAWLICSRYISPYGQQFASCKEVSLHLLSIFGHQGVAQRNPASGTNESVDIVCKVNSGNAADVSPNGDKTNGNDLFFSSPLPVPSTNHVRQDILPMVTGSPDRVQRGEVLNCHKCSMIYTKEDDLLHHLLTSHKGSAKRCKGSTSMNDEVILKDGKYECQFCHKVFDEKHRYNGHLGVHIKSYVKRVEGVVGARTTETVVQPGPAGVPPDVSKIQERTGINEQSAAGTSSARVNPPIEKADAANGTYTHTPEQNLRCKAELTTKADNTDRTLAVGSCYEQDGVCEITDRTLGKGDNSSDVISAKSNVCLSPRMDKMTNNINYSCGGTDARNHSTLEINKCVVQEGSENGSVSLSGNEIAVKTANGSCISSTGEQEQAKCHGSGLICPSVKGNICDNENTDNRPFTGTTEHMDIDGKDKVGNDKIISGSGNNSTGPERVNSNKQISCGGYSPFPYGNDCRFDFLNVADGNSAPVLVEPVQEKRSSSGLLTSSVEKQPFVLNNNNVFRASTSIFDEPKFNKIDSSWNKELTTGMAANQTTPDDGSITSSQLERNFGNCLVFQPRWDEPTSKIRNNTNPNHSTQESLNEKRNATYLYPPSGNDPTTGFHDQVYKLSDGSMDKLKSVGARKNCESISFGSNDTKQDANAATGIDQGGSSGVTFLSPSSSEQAFTFRNYGISNNNTPEYPKQDRGYGGGSNCPSGVQQVSVEDNVKRFPSRTFEELKHENVRSYWNSGLHAALDGGHGASNRNALASTQFDGQTFALGNKATRIGGNTVEDCKQKREPENSFLCLSGGGQNNLSPMYAGMVQEPNRFQDVERMRHNNPMVGFGNHAQPNEDVMTEFMWRTNGGNALQNGLASSPMVQSSGSFPTYGMVSNKGGTEHFNVNEKFGSVSGFQGFRSDSTGHLEYSFMGAQEGSNSGDKVLSSYGADISQGYGSSVWYQKEALPLLPKVAERHQVTSLCVWCRNEFHHMAADSGTQMSSMGSMCPSCKAKFSGQLSLF